MEEKNTGKTYEGLVQEIYQAFLDYENQTVGYKRIEVKHNVEMQGKTGNMHQIDVYWSFTLGGIEYKTIVEVKDWKNPVKKEQLHSFKSVLDDIPGSPIGCYVSKAGFQKGAEVVAKHHGIKLMKIEEEKPPLTMLISDIITYYDGAMLVIDESWAKEESLTEGELQELGKNMTQEEILLLNPQMTKVYLYDLMCIAAMPYYYEKDNVRNSVSKELEGEWYWLTNDNNISKVRVTGYCFECYNISTSTEIRISIPHYIVTDILGQRKYFYNALTKTIELHVL